MKIYSAHDYWINEVEAIEIPAVGLLEAVQEEVYQRILQRLANPGRLMFFAADTGLGKTTGFQKAIPRLPKDTTVLIMVPTKLDADQMYQAMEDLCPGEVGVWTQTHDPDKAEKDPRFDPSVWFTKSEAVKKRVLIVTHNCGKEAEGWIGARDLVLIDEDPGPVKSDYVYGSHFRQAFEQEAKVGVNGAVFKEADAWASSQSEDGLTPIGIPEWVDKVRDCSPRTAAGEKIKLLAEMIHRGTAFQSNRRHVAWHWFQYSLPYQEHAIIFSATAPYEGYQFAPHATGPISRDGPEVDYSQVTAYLVPRPSGVSKYKKEILSDPDQVRLFSNAVRDVCGTDGENTLLITNKDLVKHAQKAAPEVKTTYWGVDVGSNEYRDCTKVVIAGEHHLPKDAYLADYYGHSGVEEMTAEELERGQNTRGSLMRQLEELHHSRFFKQMVARGSCRNVSDVGGVALADSMELYCMIDGEIFYNLLPILLPGIQLKTIDGKPYEPNKYVRGRLGAIQAHLSETEADIVTAEDLKAVGINISGAKPKKQIEDNLSRFPGWKWIRGKPGRPVAPSKFVRVKG
ncbi:DEAD/DEAH box helicase family protein [Boseongicola aestuarii]|uniref:DEAD/DEAH box helicase n=1 Tax=Boseongicola aestuarii TaxID=1470561 RepID=A0A238J0Z2_9RHOB|nr:DEAD/DEAH box helicase family protein [Boseongicola aestuarii]SMX23650.1 DEAD/DEAH box helicase [Boseongicola aestuarii]